MHLTGTQADEILMRAGIAAIYYDPLEGAASAEYSIEKDIDFVLEDLEPAQLQAEDLDELRRLCRHAISDPTTARRQLRDHVLSAVVSDEPAA
ncbi:hypothetical protein E5344_03305 [Microbacterium laevaniformans]|jgi:hypothetical protein|uniref:Uncharacterized protein n=1 Tax=Microbacterium laevaniformans TaxID=36807 RepID=A0A4S2DCS0_9MICO|nr:hypothetical protein [Microbacterium laevaniformans]TGY39636.1 hypothetical protein E5344_03305 [Microbacterium laevaniformans]